jgi:uncharacterized protein
MTDDGAPFWAAGAQRRLEFQRCDGCGFVRWPAAGVCPECLGRAATWTEVDGDGTLWSFAIYHRAYAKTGIPPVPYNVGLVELACGVRLLSRIVGVPGAQLRVGMPVRVTFRHVGENGLVPVFEPAESAETS